MIRVLVINGGDLLFGGVVKLLSQEDDFEVIKRDFSDSSTLISVLEDFRPVVLIINESLLFTDLYAIFDCLRDFSGLRVIALNIQKNLLHIFEKKEYFVGGASDLFDIVRWEKNISA